MRNIKQLRPQLYDKKPDIDNDDPTAWYKESGIIAQGIYYDAPELKQLVHRGSHELDDEGNIIQLPEIPTSIDPQQDPDYPSWGEDPASIRTVFMIFESQTFKLSVSNPKSKQVAYLSVLSQISNCQGLGRKNKFEILKTYRELYWANRIFC